MAGISNHLIKLSILIGIPNSTCSSTNFYYFPQYLLHLESLLISVDGSTILLLAQIKKKRERERDDHDFCFFISHTVTIFSLSGNPQASRQNTPRLSLLSLLPDSLQSRLLGEISITSDMQMTPPLWLKVKTN